MGTYLTGSFGDGAASVPAELADLLNRPLVAALATQRPDGSLQCNPMWFAFDGETLRMSHTSTRQKIRNIEANPQVSLCIADPDNTFRYVELRGLVTAVDPDADAEFHRELRLRYGMDHAFVADAAERVIITVVPTYIGGREMADPTTVTE